MRVYCQALLRAKYCCFYTLSSQQMIFFSPFFSCGMNIACEWEHAPLILFFALFRTPKLSTFICLFYCRTIYNSIHYWLYLCDGWRIFHSIPRCFECVVGRNSGKIQFLLYAEHRNFLSWLPKNFQWTKLANFIQSLFLIAYINLCWECR